MTVTIFWYPLKQPHAMCTHSFVEVIEDERGYKWKRCHFCGAYLGVTDYFAAFEANDTSDQGTRAQ